MTGFSPSPRNMLSIRPECARFETAPVIFSRPEKRIPKPIAILPMEREFFIRPPMISTIPMIRATGASVEGWKKRSQDEAPASRSRSLMIWPVMVVPTLAPMMMPRDWWSVRMPAPTRPEVMTMVAVDD